MVLRIKALLLASSLCFAANLSFSASAQAADHPRNSAEAPNSALASNEYSVTLPPILDEKTPVVRVKPHNFLRGWDHLYDLLVDEGLDPVTLAEIFADRRMPAHKTLYFSVSPREQASIYRRHNTAGNREHALRFYREHQQTFENAQKIYHVQPSIVLSLLQIETSCGENTGDERVFPRLARLAAATEPKTLLDNFVQKNRRIKSFSFDQIKARASTLQELFLEHTAATVSVARAMSVDPLELRGSSAGAIGIPQFLPGNVRRFGADGNGDGKVDVFNAEDSIYSVANFLHSYGWNESQSLTLECKRDILRNYNRSEPYVDTALAMAHGLEKGI